MSTRSSSRASISTRVSSSSCVRCAPSSASASLYASATIRSISPSITAFVSLLMKRSSATNCPTRVDMPYSVTAARAIWLTFSRSFFAPLDTRPKTICSAARPPSAAIIASCRCVWSCSARSSRPKSAKPIACPRGSIVTCCAFSWFSHSSAQITWPASWYAIFSSSPSAIGALLRFGPASTRRIPSRRSSCVISSRSSRAAMIAASLTSSASCAPEKPPVYRASASKSTSSASGRSTLWTRRISRRPSSDGVPTAIWRERRPGRSSAGSSTSGRFVAATTTTCALDVKPSICTSSSFSVDSRSPLPSCSERARPSASISSRKMTEGAAAIARLKSSRTRWAPTPTYFSTNSEPLAEK